MTKSQITCSWNLSRLEETRVAYAESFEELNRIEQLDFLQDILGILTDKYNLILETREKQK